MRLESIHAPAEVARVNRDMTLLDRPSDLMVPMPEMFWHESTLHGQAHVTRVMIHAARLAAATHQAVHSRRLWAAVFLHDIARTHDGTCHRHGADAAVRLRTEVTLQRRLTDAGLTEDDFRAIEAAVTAHSAPQDVPRSHPHWALIALLKDADGLDRVRLGDLDPSRLRHPEAVQAIPFAQRLFDRTDGAIALGEQHFAKVVEIAQVIEVD